MYISRLAYITTNIKPSLSAWRVNKSIGIQKMIWIRCAFTMSAKKTGKEEGNENFWVKNERLQRPVSPHLTIYKPQVTSMLSITHRGTGLFLSAGITSFSIGMLLLPGSFPHYLNLIEAAHYGSLLIFSAKFCLAFPFIFHAFNGIRHLVWDVGYGFSLRDLYKSGYFVLGSSLILSAIAAAL